MEQKEIIKTLIDTIPDRLSLDLIIAVLNEIDRKYNLDKKNNIELQETLSMIWGMVG